MRAWRRWGGGTGSSRGHRGLGEGFPTPRVPAARAAGLGSERVARLAACLSRCLTGRVSSLANLPSSFNALGKGRGVREVGMKQGGVTTRTVAETKNFWWICSQRRLVADKSPWGWEGEEEGMRSEGLWSCRGSRRLPRTEASGQPARPEPSPAWPQRAGGGGRRATACFTMEGAPQGQQGADIAAKGSWTAEKGTHLHGGSGRTGCPRRRELFLKEGSGVAPGQRGVPGPPPSPRRARTGWGCSEGVSPAVTRRDMSPRWARCWAGEPGVRLSVLPARASPGNSDRLRLGSPASPSH